MATYNTRRVGAMYGPDFKVYVTEDERIISPFHDIPTTAGKYIRAVNEIPRFEHAKFEIAKGEPLNPIVQDTKKGKLRFLANVYPFYGYPWNYGAIPQTWENPNEKDPLCEAKGDNDPVDILDIGTRRKAVGEVYEAKVLGAIALLDDGETDWKIIAIDSKDPLAGRLNGIDDVRHELPGILDDMIRWYRDYKVPDGKGKNAFALGGRILDAAEARKIIDEAHAHWEALMRKGSDSISLVQTRQPNAKSYVAEFTPTGSEEPACPRPDCLYEVHYVK